MGNSLVFPVPKCSYTPSSLQPFYHSIPAIDYHYSTKIGAIKSIKRSIPSLLIRSSMKSKYLMIYFHGNCDDLGKMFPRLLDYYEHFQIDILAPEYPGYGIYKGQPNATRMTIDAQHIIEYVTRADGLNYPIENVIVIGRSLGSAVAIQLGVKYPALGGIAVISPYTSIRDVAINLAGSLSKLIIPDVFHSEDMISELKVPIIFIHGVKDDVIPYSHSIKLYEKCGSSKKYLELRESMDHNRCKLERDIFMPIEKFFNEKLQKTDLPSQKSEPLEFMQIFGEEEGGEPDDTSLKQRSQTSSIYSLMGKSQLTVRVSKSDSLPEKSNMNVMSQSVAPGWKTKLQVSRPQVKKVDSDPPIYMGSMFKCPL